MLVGCSFNDVKRSKVSTILAPSFPNSSNKSSVYVEYLIVSELNSGVRL